MRSAPARGERLRKICVSGTRTSPSSRQTKPRRAGEIANCSSGSRGSLSRSSSSASIFRSSPCVRSASPRWAKATTTRLPPRTKAASSFSASARPRAATAGRCPSNGEPAPLVRALDALVAGEGDSLGQVVDGDLVADGEPDRLRPRPGRRQQVGEGGRGGAHEAAARQHVERTGPLADEVRRRLEPGAPADAAAREERDLLVAEE